MLLHKQETSDLCLSPTIVRRVKSRRLRWARHVARVGRQGINKESWWRNLLGNVHLRYREGDGRITLRRMLDGWILVTVKLPNHFTCSFFIHIWTWLAENSDNIFQFKKVKKFREMGDQIGFMSQMCIVFNHCIHRSQPTFTLNISVNH